MRRALLSAGLALALAAPAALAQQPLGPPKDALASDGTVFDMTRLGDLVYIRGNYERLGRYTGPGIGLDPASGAMDPSFAALDGQISDIVGDGSGGWFIGGDFDEVDNVPRSRIAHIRANGTLDPDFHPAVNGLVTSLARDGTRLFFGGFFDQVDGEFRQGAASVNTTDGGLLPFDAKQVGRVTELVFAPASDSRSARVYLGAGEINALDPDTGRAVPGFSSDVHADIRALAVSDTRLYVGGNGLIAIDATTGDRDTGFKATPRDLADEAAFAGTVHVLTLDSGRLFAGGDFNALGGATGPLVSLDPVSGRADRNFTPQVGTPAPSGSGEDEAGDRGVFDVARIGDRLWVGGLFARAGGKDATNLAAINSTTGDRLDVTVPVLDGQVNALEPGSTRLYVGGQFFMAGYTRARGGIVAVSAETAALKPDWAENFPGCCGVLSSDAGRVFLATEHSEGYEPSVKPTKRHPKPLYYPKPQLDRIHAVDAATGNMIAGFETRRIRGVASVAPGRRELYVARRLDSRVRFPRNRIVVLDPEDGSIKRTYPVPLPGYVAHMAVLGDSLYLAGSFRRFRLGGQPAHLAIIKLDPRNGMLDEEFDPHAHGPVYDLATKSNSIYFAGLFDRVQGVKRRGIAAVGSRVGFLATSFDPPRDKVAGTNSVDLTALRSDILFQRFGNRFLDAFTGEIHTNRAGGYARDVDFATPTATGILYSATITLPLAGQSENTLSFVAPAAR